MAMPEKVRVGYADYSVTVLDKCEDGDLGRCYQDGLRITIKRGMPPQAEAEVLLHEVLHACYWIAGLEGKAAAEEEVCNRLAMVLAGVIRDNPPLIAYLQEALG